MTSLRIDRGIARAVPLQVLSPARTPYAPATNPSPFLGSDTLAAKVWTGDGSPPVATPAVAWLDPTIGTFQISFVAADTVNLPPGFYSIRVTVTLGTSTGSIFDGSLQVNPSPGPALTPGTVPTFPASVAPSPLAVVYATDEEVALCIPRDYASVCPVWQSLASGVDGTFEPNAPWVLTSTSVNFQTMGVGPGNVVSLDKSSVGLEKGSLFAVDSASGGSLMLRRLGQQLGVGMPPGPLGGTSGVKFDVRTFSLQIDDASYDVNRIFGIDPDIPNRSPSQLRDLRELRRLTATMVAVRAFTENSEEKADDFARKLALLADQESRLRESVSVQWGALGLSDRPSSIKTGTVIR